MEVDILGTKYKIIYRKISEDKTMSKNMFSGYCSGFLKEIVIADMSEEEYFPDMKEEERENYKKETIRHEIIHAFLIESGLNNNASVPNSGWARNEEMVDWIAIQFPKILKAFDRVGVL